MSKEQKEVITLIFILTAIVVSACIMLVIMPKLKDVAGMKKSLKQVNIDIDKERTHSKQLLELSEKKDELIASIEANETGLFGGIMVGDLSKVVNTIVRSDFRDVRLNSLGDNAEVLPGGSYNELVNELTIKDCDFHEAIRFISTLENANPGIRISNIEINDGHSRVEELGKVTVGLEVRMVGLHDGEGIELDWVPQSNAGYQPGDIRNPFGPSGMKAVVDPEQAFKDKAYSIKITMNTGDSVWVKDMSDEDRGARECLIKKYMPVFRPAKVRLMKIHEDYFIVQRDDGKVFKFHVREMNETISGKIRERGTIKEVEELKQ